MTSLICKLHVACVQEVAVTIQDDDVQYFAHLTTQGDSPIIAEVAQTRPVIFWNGGDGFLQ